MAKASINLVQARALCTVAEYRIVKASLSSRLTEAQVRTKIRLVRDLQDKWRDQSKRQRRSAQEQFGKRAVDASGRSKEKAKLFTDLLALLESRAGSSKAAVAKTPKKAARTSAAPKSAAPKSAAPKSDPKPAPKSAPKSAPKPAAKAPVRARTSATAIGSAGLLAASLDAGEHTPATSIAVAAPAHRAVRPARKAQLAATTAVKSQRFKESGERRTMSHVKASGKRAQARRDSRA